MAFGRFSQLRKHAGTSPQSAPPPKSPIVLVIDDDLRIREGLTLNLQATYCVRVCASGEEGIQAVDSDVSAVVLDIKMPGKDGLEVYTAMKARFPNLPIIFYSAYQSMLEGAELSRKYRPFNYIDKSADVRELFETIARAVNYSQRMQQLATNDGVCPTVSAVTAA
jgi:DNA-binding NtrC family response regulator